MNTVLHMPKSTAPFIDRRTPLSKDAEPLPFHYQLKEALKQKVISGEWREGTMIPSEFQLIDQFGVSRTTVVKALSTLVHEGLLYRQQGRGTFVARPSASLSAREIVGLIMPMTGHLYEPMSSAIVRGLTEHDYFCVLVDSTADENGDHRKIESLLKKRPAKLVIEGGLSFPYHLLDGYSGEIIFVFRFQGEREYPADYILSDYHEGGRLAAQHFIALGHQQILFFAPKAAIPDHIQTPRVPAGLRQAFRENRLPEANLVIVENDPPGQAEQRLRDHIAKAPKPVAVFAEADWMAARVYDIAKQLALRIPEDVAVIGYFNTPWCEMLDPHLTSVSTREEVIAEKVIRKLIHGGEKERILVKPELIVRKSCGARPGIDPEPGTDRRRLNPQHGSRATNAFTLVELLVVIAIMAMLMALLAPALKAAREKGRAIACMNNLRQMYLGALTYMGDYDGKFPAVFHYDTGWWSFGLLDEQAGGKGYIKGKSTVIWWAFPWEHGYPTGLWRCPTVKEIDCAHYGLNAYTFGWQVIFNWTIKDRAWSSIAQPESRLFISEMDSVQQIYSSVAPDDDPWVAAYPPGGRRIGRRHSGGANALFCDGHVQWISDPSYFKQSNQQFWGNPSETSQ